ncbi:LOW QUALITY PROTEIN: hypothetical protein YC2023_107640 [Brassica napus]
MPKALNHVIRLGNWESVLKLTQPESWSPNSMYKATNMFASSSKADASMRFFFFLGISESTKSYILSLPISEKGTLQAQRILLWNNTSPLEGSGTCTIPEAVITGSIIHKFSSPGNSSSAALVCLAEMEFLGTRR